MGQPEGNNEMKWMGMVDYAHVPLESRLNAVSPFEVGLGEETRDAIRVGRRYRAGRPRQKPARVIRDRGYYSDVLRERPQPRSLGWNTPLGSPPDHFPRQARAAALQETLVYRTEHRLARQLAATCRVP